jgi:hypothetical protein
LTALVLVLTMMAPMTMAADYDTQYMYDFGHVGIDYVLAHTFWLVNTGSEPIRIAEVRQTCECTRAYATDSVVAPGDTVYFPATFNTKDYYGPTERSFTVVLDDEDHTELVYAHRAIIGQWYYGLKPEPFSLFFLPGHDSHKVTVTNSEHESLGLEFRDQADTTFTVKLLRTKASKGEQLEMEVTPREGLKPGTYLTNFSVEVKVKGGAVPAILTVPVKIVRY